MVCVALVVSASAWGQAGTGTEYDDAELPVAEAAGDRLVPAELVIREDVVLRPFEARMFGFNWNWFFANPMVVEPETNVLRDDFVEAMRGLSVPLQRMTGTESQYFQWRKATGPYAERQPFSLRPFHGSPAVRVGFGPLEWVRLMRRINPEVELVWCLNLYQDAAEDHADFAELMMYDGVGNPNGGVDWAAVRRNAGIEGPAPIILWELGNELDEPWHQDVIPDVEAYIERCGAAIEAVRSITPGARFAAHAVTAPWSEKKNLKKFGPDGHWKEWHRRVLEELGDEIDYMVFHPYYAGYPIPTVYRFVSDITDDIRRITGSDRIKIYFSEHARWPPRPSDGRPWSAYFHKSHSLEAVLAVSEFINLGHSRNDVAMMTYHILHGGPWRTIDRRPDGEGFFFTGIADLFNLYQSTMSGAVVESSLAGPETDVTSDSLRLSALVTRDDDRSGLTLFVVNRSASSTRRLRLTTLDGPYRLTDRWTIHHEDLDAHNTADDRPLAPRHQAYEEPGVLRSLDVSPQTITVLRLTRDDADAASRTTQR
ncbi:hypothetical protein [Mucisphaera calidilacus]|uniref:hypothetical protein n=1 Tax=Mucisphaera calidilacus TaxID=2527982 RepID=UPI00119F0E29|nr:hypothetical protein [Mucisphaera calidilacus]